jgi:hypothetical protein
MVAFTEPADAFGPARSVTTGASRCGVGEDTIRNDPCSRNGILLLVGGLLSGGDAKVGSNAHGVYNDKSPTINPVSDPGELGFPCDTEKSDSATWSFSEPVRCPLAVPDL